MNFIRDLLNENNIILKATAFNKEEAVRLVMEPLLKRRKYNRGICKRHFREDQ